MKTIFDKAIRDKLIERINILNENSAAQWGKMNIYQMLKHCTIWEQMALGKKEYKQSFLGRLFGKMALKDFIKDENPLKRDVPTVPEFKIKENSGNVTQLKKSWIALLEEYGNFSNLKVIHPFFGKITKEQVGYLAYKHIDHHLRQFNA